MRWKGKNLPQRGDKRVLKRFAILPKRLSDGTVIVFESYEIFQTYRVALFGVWETDYIK